MFFPVRRKEEVVSNSVSPIPDIRCGKLPGLAGTAPTLSLEEVAAAVLEPAGQRMATTVCPEAAKDFGANPLKGGRVKRWTIIPECRK